jgi:hypothetical protein
MGMSSRKARRGASRIALGVSAILLVGTAVTGLYLLGLASPAAVSSSTSSSIPTHTTSSHSGTLTSTLNQTASYSSLSATSVRTILGDAPQNILAGVCGPSSRSYTTELLPADTLVWTSYTINTTEYLDSATVSILATTQNYNTTVAALFYLNGSLEASGGSPIPSPAIINGSSPTIYNVGASVTINSTVAAGSQVSLALWSPTPIKVIVNLISPQTYTYSVTSLPRHSDMLPSVSEASTLSYAPDFCAYNYQGGG